MTRRTQLAVGEYYHIYNRGVDKRAIFQSDADKQRFLKLLYLCNNTQPVNIRSLSSSVKSSAFGVFGLPRDEQLVHVGAYCLLRNHFHLLLKERIENGISRYMQKCATAYTMYFNTKCERTGSLFEGRFKAQHACNDNYLKYLFAYIHLNPIEHIEPQWKENGIKNIKRANIYLLNYRYSSYAEYMGVQRPFSNLLDCKAFPEYFIYKEDFLSHLTDWLQPFDDIDGVFNLSLSKTKVQPLYKG